MDIKELKNEKSILESKIEKFIVDFVNKTDLEVESVDLKKFYSEKAVYQVTYEIKLP